jgi:hypothetical protein
MRQTVNEGNEHNEQPASGKEQQAQRFFLYEHVHEHHENEYRGENGKFDYKKQLVTEEAVTYYTENRTELVLAVEKRMLLDRGVVRYALKNEHTRVINSRSHAQIPRKSEAALEYFATLRSAQDVRDDKQYQYFKDKYGYE